MTRFLLHVVTKFTKVARCIYLMEAMATGISGSSKYIPVAITS